MAARLTFNKQHFQSVASTNDLAREAADQGHPEGLVVTATQQVQGRGRTGAVWSSPPGNLYQSLLLRPPVSPAAAGQLSFIASLALHQAITELLPDQSCRCKWPNDVLCDDAKIAGILLESKLSSSGALDWIIVGMGVNVAYKPLETPYPVTKINELVGGAEITPTELHDKFLETFSTMYGSWLDFGFAGIRRLWLERAKGLNETIRVRLPNEERKGTFAGIDESGSLILRSKDGAEDLIAAGAVFFEA